MVLDRSIPKEAREEYRHLTNDGLVNLFLGRNETAEEYFRKQIQLLFQVQENLNRPIHKGTPFHNLGLSQFGQRERLEDSIYNFLLAYTEDTLNVDVDWEEEADRARAARVLRDILQIRLRILREVKRVSYELKKERWAALLDPEPILQIALNNLSVSPPLSAQCNLQVVPAKTMPLGFPQPWEKRVFVGTNYDTFFHVVDDIKEAVMQSGYTPVVAAEVAIPTERIHHHSLMLLHTCAEAIFDVTNPAGQYMEIERLRDYEIRPLLVRSARSGGPSKPAWLSRTIETMGFEVFTYSDIPHLKKMVEEHLRARAES